MPFDAELLISQMLDAYNQQRFSDFSASHTNDAVIFYPQSGARIVGRKSIQGMLEAFPTPPRFNVSWMSSGADLVVTETDVDYGEGPMWKGVFNYWMDGKRVRSEHAYFSEPFESPDWRTPYRQE